MFTLVGPDYLWVRTENAQRRAEEAARYAEILRQTHEAQKRTQR